VAYVVFAEELEDVADIRPHTVASLEQAFAQIIDRCGFTHHFEREEEGWRLILSDQEDPSRYPDPILSTYIKPRDAHYDLMAQAVDGRLRGHIAVDLAVFNKQFASAATVSAPDETPAEF
jgi:hypothetical protein